VRVFYRANSRDEIVRAIEAGITALAARVPLREVVLFGSSASNRHTAASDVDLLIVYGGPPRDDVFGMVKDVMQLPRLEPHVYSQSQAEALASVLQRMTRGGIRIYPPAAGLSATR
jgi:predicted nucleotidyltransferase